MNPLFRHLTATLLLAMPISTPIVANDALQRIPENTLGFAMVRNLTRTSTTFDQLLQPFDVTFPSPLTFAKLVTGLDEGLDLSGDMVIAFLPAASSKGTSSQGTSSKPASSKTDTELMVLLPISDYETFATSINADTSGEICRVTILGEDILVAQDGPYALLMNVEHLQTMEELVALEAESVTALAPLRTWLRSQDVALVLMPGGVKQVSNWKLQPTHRLGIGSQFARPRSLLSELGAEVLSPETRHWFRSNMDLAAIGVAVDDESNVRLTEQLIFQADSPITKIATPTTKQPAIKLGLSKQPFVFTAGGSLASGWGKRLASFLRQAEQSRARESGLENVSRELWDQEEEAFQHLLAEIRSCSVVMLQGKKGEPLLGNFLGVATVPDVSKYLESLPQVVKTWNALTQLSTSDIKLDVELVPITVDGDHVSSTYGSKRTGSEKAGLEFVVDIASQAQDPNVPALNWLLESVLGPSGKLRVQLVPIDRTTFVFCLATPEQLAELLTVVTQDASNLPAAAAAQASLDLLQPASQWKGLIDPQGCLVWASRVANEFLATLTNREVNFPTLPDSQPVGMAAHFADQRWECELVCPADTWKNLGNYVATFRNQ